MEKKQQEELEVWSSTLACIYNAAMVWKGGGKVLSREVKQKELTYPLAHEATNARDGAPSPSPSTALGVEEDRKLSTAVQQIYGAEAEKADKAIYPPSANLSADLSASTITSSRLSPRSHFPPGARAADDARDREPAQPRENAWGPSRPLSPTHTDGQRRKTVRHSEVVYIIPATPRDPDAVSSDAGASNNDSLDVEKVLTKPRTGHRWEKSELVWGVRRLVWAQGGGLTSLRSDMFL
ncbi:hypothetical protein B0T22DRAFT_437790 [Podospora appendiculata]|uniref:Uncharacterized protein n=1 Tax=Podospora appendiculata TaxID=314037 RepID=A0AAE0XJS7_9PEZI|nr:hypothetical protein B0T22DRAFT_437790 [Podospora appendiculata]